MVYQVQFIPVKHGGYVEWGNTGLPQISGDHKIVGFKPGPTKKREGWLIVLINPQKPNKPKRALKA